MDREQTTIRLPKKLMDSLRQEAEERGISLNAYILMILNEEKNRSDQSGRSGAQN